MKFKIDFVTNSSSETFGIVIGDFAQVGCIFGFLAMLLNSCKDPDDIGSLNHQMAHSINDAVDSAEEIAKEIANAALKDAERRDEILNKGISDAENSLNAARIALEREIEACKQVWEDSEKTSDKSDPGYADFVKQYEEYMDYLNLQVQEVDYQKELIAYEKAQRTAELEAKQSWVKMNQGDYIAVKEEKALLEAVSKGYNVPGYDASKVNERLAQLNAREKELEKILRENNAAIDYQAKDRGVIAPSQESMALNQKIIEERERFEREAKEATAQKRAKLQAEMEKNIEEYKRQMASAARWDMATKAAEGVQLGADIAIDGLAHVTGPAGQKVKLAYSAGKNLGSGVGGAIADPDNAAKHIAKGVLNAGADVVKDRFGSDKPWQQAATGILNEGLQAGLDASIKGGDVIDAMGKGLTKGVFDAGVDKGLDVLKGKLPIPKGSSVDVSDFSVSQVLGNNPLATGLSKTLCRETVSSQVTSRIKDSVVDQAGKHGGFDN